MTLADILSGPTTDRTHNASHPMTEPEARHILQQIERQMSRKQRGASVRRLADMATRLTDEARELYRAYATAYGA